MIMRGSFPISCAIVLTLTIAVCVPNRSRGLPLDRVENARRNAGLQADSLEAMPPAMTRGDIGVDHYGPRELGEAVLDGLATGRTQMRRMSRDYGEALRACRRGTQLGNESGYAGG